MSTSKKRVAILISGRGSNMSALIEAANDTNYPAQIVAVISDKAEARGLAIATAHGIEAIAITKSDYPTKAALDSALDAELKRMQIDIVCLAGYMRLLSADFTQKWAGRIINIHPSILPLFPGLNTHQRALDAGLRVHGCSVHFVTAGMDEGPIISQAVVPVLADDNEETLGNRVLKAEHQLYSQALQLVADGRANMNGNRVELRNVSADGILLSPNAAEESIDIESLARMTP